LTQCGNHDHHYEILISWHISCGLTVWLILPEGDIGSGGTGNTFAIIALFWANQVRTISGRAAVRWSRC